mmetsp:Transcript_83142/g.269159  ORF Transcript_83142/g.269159 Transcript_83142/m.269159 type:complete len:304 (-) Transcript_83142:623-1534(-)
MKYCIWSSLVAELRATLGGGRGPQLRAAAGAARIALVAEATRARRRARRSGGRFCCHRLLDLHLRRPWPRLALRNSARNRMRRLVPIPCGHVQQTRLGGFCWVLNQSRATLGRHLLCLQTPFRMWCAIHGRLRSVVYPFAVGLPHQLVQWKSGLLGKPLHRAADQPPGLSMWGRPSLLPLIPAPGQAIRPELLAKPALPGIRHVGEHQQVVGLRAVQQHQLLRMLLHKAPVTLPAELLHPQIIPQQAVRLTLNVGRQAEGGKTIKHRLQSSVLSTRSIEATWDATVASPAVFFLAGKVPQHAQ